jgi:hypothetical protein
MKLKAVFLIWLLAMVLVAGDAVLPLAGYAETQGTDRREDRGDARDTKQTGRQEGREVKDDCREGEQNRPDCRQEKRETKQDARKGARSIKTND